MQAHETTRSASAAAARSGGTRLIFSSSAPAIREHTSDELVVAITAAHRHRAADGRTDKKRPERHERYHDGQPAAAGDAEPEQQMFPVTFAVNTRPGPR